MRVANNIATAMAAEADRAVKKDDAARAKPATA